MTKEDKFEIGLTLNKIAMLLSNDDFHKVKNLLKHIEQIIAEQSEAYTPQTDCDKCIWSVCNYNKVDWDADTPQTDCPYREYPCDMCDEQTDCAWK